MKRKTIVIKYGSSSVCNQEGMNMHKLQQYSKMLASLCTQFNVILVSSGSVAVGRCLWVKNKRANTQADMRHYAMLGSAKAFTAWQKALLSKDLLAGQLLVTHREVDDPTEGPSLRAAIEANIQAGIISIINENDALSDIELAKLSYGGDNDGLAAHVAISVNAKKLCLLTNVEGLLDEDILCRVVAANEIAWKQAANFADSSISLSGRGGMISKITAATAAARKGIDVYIADAAADLSSVVAGKAGTHFVAAKIKGRMEERKQS